jgi:hypothetical protein
MGKLTKKDIKNPVNKARLDYQKSRKNPIEYLEVSLYYLLDDEDNKLYDEDSIRDEFERKLQEILK